MGQERKAASGASRAAFASNHTRLSHANDEARLNSLGRESAGPRPGPELDKRVAAMRRQNRNGQNQAARRQDPIAVHHSGIPPPPVSVYRTQHEWNAKVDACTATIKNQASDIEKLKRALNDQQVQLQKAATVQQAMQNDLQRRQTKHETEVTAWKDMYFGLNRQRTEHHKRIEQVEQESRDRIQRAENEADRLRKQTNDIRRDCDESLEWSKEDHQDRMERVKRKAQRRIDEAESGTALLQKRIDTIQRKHTKLERKYTKLEENFRLYEEEVSQQACPKCSPRLRPRRTRSYYDDLDVSDSRPAQSFV